MGKLFVKFLKTWFLGTVYIDGILLLPFLVQNFLTLTSLEKFTKWTETYGYSILRTRKHYIEETLEHNNLKMKMKILSQLNTRNLKNC